MQTVIYIVIAVVVIGGIVWYLALKKKGGETAGEKMPEAPKEGGEMK